MTVIIYAPLGGRHDTQQNEAQHDDTQHKGLYYGTHQSDTQHNDTQSNDTQLKGLYVT
jgi:hypothetical protein